MQFWGCEMTVRMIWQYDEHIQLRLHITMQNKWKKSMPEGLVAGVGKQKEDYVHINSILTRVAPNALNSA